MEPGTSARLPVVALLGRPNVGKSTLFNALTRSREALVADYPGLTRDRQYGVVRVGERPFVVIDTGGITDDQASLARLTRQQAQLAVEEADVLVLIVDAHDGLQHEELEFLRQLRTANRPILLVINKIDGIDPNQALAEFAPLGLAEPMLIAAAQQRGILKLATRVLELVPELELAEVPEPDPDRIRVAFVGRPNVGKSTLINRLLGEDRLLASDQPGTTRDAIGVDLERDGIRFHLVDTAGLRRRAKVDETVEKFSAVKSLQAIERAQVCVLMLDAQQGIADQDASVLGHVLQAGRGLVVAVNKWDGLTAEQREWTQRELARRLDFVPWAERPFISGLHGSGLRELMLAIRRSHRSATAELSTPALTEALEQLIQVHQPPMSRGRAPKMRYAHAGGRNPPTIVIHGSRTNDLPASYRRYLENSFRERFGLVGTPLRMEFRDGKNPFADRRNELTERQVRKRKRLMRHVKKR